MSQSKSLRLGRVILILGAVVLATAACTSDQFGNQLDSNQVDQLNQTLATANQAKDSALAANPDWLNQVEQGLSQTMEMVKNAASGLESFSSSSKVTSTIMTTSTASKK
jgi:predicted PurR-regulated permease PerM